MRAHVRAHTDRASDVANFSSNNYLGLARDAALHRETLAEWQRLATDPGSKNNSLLGSTGSRLLSGNTVRARESMHANVARSLTNAVHTGGA